MNQKLEKYYNDYFDLFGTDGWKQLMEDLSENSKVINNVRATKDSEDMYFRKGQLNVLDYMLNLQDTMETSYKEVSSD